MSGEGVAQVLTLFERSRNMLTGLVAPLADDPATVIETARGELEAMAPTLAYLDAPRSGLANALFFCAIHLAVFRVLREQRVSAHRYGAAMLDALAQLPPGADAEPPSDPDWAKGPGTHAGEFDVELVPGEAPDSWGYNIKSCAICHLYGQHDAMELVPYMCASDDVMSDQAGQGLRRTGTIALGAQHCDFRYQAGGEPLRVAEQYPDRIRVVTEN